MDQREDALAAGHLKKLTDRAEHPKQRTVTFAIAENPYAGGEHASAKFVTTMTFERGGDLPPFRQAAECRDERSGIATLLEYMAQRLRGDIDAMPYIELK